MTSTPKKTASFLCGAALALLASSAPAQGLKNPQWQALADARRFAELEQSAAARLATHADDGDAWFAYTRALLGEHGADASRRGHRRAGDGAGHDEGGVRHRPGA
jgi:hypothetical protein